MADELISSIFFLTICHLLLILVLISSAIFIIYRLFFAKKALHRSEKVVALGFTAYLFRNTLHRAIISPLADLTYNLQRLFYLYQEISRAQDTSEGRQKLEQTPPNIDISIVEILRSFPFAQFLVFLASGIIVFWTLRLVQQKVSFSSTVAEILLQLFTSIF